MPARCLLTHTSRLILVLVLLVGCESAVRTTEPPTTSQAVETGRPARPTTSEPVETSQAAQPAYPGALVLEDTRSDGTEAFFYLPDIEGAPCRNWVTTFATEQPVKEVVAFYEGLGFRSIFPPRETALPDEGMFRWTAVLEGDEETWRRVDVSTGEFVRHPEWATVVTLYAPDCRSLEASRGGPTPHPCQAEPGSPLNLEGELDLTQLARYLRWTDREGCMVHFDVLVEFIGEAHCDWEDARVIVTGDPLGEPQRPFRTLIYVKDPQGVYGMRGLMEGFQVLEELPADAVDTGYRQGQKELWLSPDDPDAVYLQTPEGVERWPEGEPPLCF